LLKTIIHEGRPPTRGPPPPPPPYPSTVSRSPRGNADEQRTEEPHPEPTEAPVSPRALPRAPHTRPPPPPPRSPQQLQPEIQLLSPTNESVNLVTMIRSSSRLSRVNSEDIPDITQMNEHEQNGMSSGVIGY
jgi:hypothetical protein